MGRWRLSRKILCLALLNVLLLGAVVLAFARAQFRLGTEAFLLGPAKDRIMAIANAFSVELDGAPQGAYESLFTRYGQQYDATFFLTDPGGMALAGPSPTLPAEVLDRMRRRGAGPPRRRGELKGEQPAERKPDDLRNDLRKGPGDPRKRSRDPRKSPPEWGRPFDREGPPAGAEFRPFDRVSPPAGLEDHPYDRVGPPEGREGPPPGMEGRPPRPPHPPEMESSPASTPAVAEAPPVMAAPAPQPALEPPPRGRSAFAEPKRPGRGPQPEPVFLAISQTPKAYWVGVRIPVSLPGLETGTPGILLIRSASMFNGKIFLDLGLVLGLAFCLAAVSGLCWLPFIRGLTRSIGQMDRVTQQIAEGNFDAQVSAGRRDELGHLGEQINRMAGRLQHFVTSQKRFLGDIAHELCAPIARIQFALGILEQKSEDSQRQHVAVLHEEVQEMSGLVNELLSFSKAGLHPERVPLSAVDVDGVVHRVVSREAFTGAGIETRVEPGLSVMGNEAFLLRALSNVLRNAVRYAGSSGPITVTARRDAGAVEIRVADSGPGLPESELEEIFAPFYRPEAARTRETGGAGLGLAIVKTCVEACGGTVSCQNRQPAGLEVIMRFTPA